MLSVLSSFRGEGNLRGRNYQAIPCLYLVAPLRDAYHFGQILPGHNAQILHHGRTYVRREEARIEDA